TKRVPTDTSGLCPEELYFIFHKAVLTEIMNPNKNNGAPCRCFCFGKINEASCLGFLKLEGGF
ncbi:MAG: hypothetical protein AAB362_00445, partial [Patescibacteria group bacterium]